MPCPRSFRKAGRIFGYKGPVQVRCVINASKLVNVEQGEKSGDDSRVLASLSRRETQVDTLKAKLSAMSSQQIRDMEAHPRKCGAGDVEL